MLTKVTLPLKRYVEYRNGFLKALAFSFHKLIRLLILIWDYLIKLYYFPSPGHALNLNNMPKQKHSWNPLYDWCVFLSILQHLIPCSLPSGGSPVWPIIKALPCPLAFHWVLPLGNPGRMSEGQKRFPWHSLWSSHWMVVPLDQGTQFLSRWLSWDFCFLSSANLSLHSSLPA